MIYDPKPLINRYRRSAKRWYAKKTNQRKLTLVILLIAVASLFFGLVFSLNNSSEQNYSLIQERHSIHKLKKALDVTKHEKATTEAELKAKAQHEADQQKQIDDLNKQLQAKNDRQKQLASAQAVSVPAPIAPLPQPAYTPQAGAVVSGCGDNFYANFIYMHESGCNTGALNSGGCFGIGQACPGSKLAYCGTDYTCQNAFFTDYASKYGGWAGSYAFWVAHSWW